MIPSTHEAMQWEVSVTEVKRYSLVKPTLQTKFHIDFDWWSQIDNDWRVYLQSLLCTEHQQTYADSKFDELIDWVDPETAEIQNVDGLRHILITHCARQTGFITDRTTLVDAVFRVFLANGNAPLSSTELAEKLSRPPDTIIRTLAGIHVYRGIRPCQV
jgi:hypothetical protein